MLQLMDTRGGDKIADLARQTTASSPPASSAAALAALGPVWTALKVVIGWPLAWS